MPAPAPNYVACLIEVPARTDAGLSYPQTLKGYLVEDSEQYCLPEELALLISATKLPYPEGEYIVVYVDTPGEGSGSRLFPRDWLRRPHKNEQILFLPSKPTQEEKEIWQNRMAQAASWWALQEAA